MSAFNVIFYKGPETFFGRLIRWWTKSPYSHCALYFRPEGAPGFILEAMAGIGVRERLMVGIDATLWDTVAVPVSKESYEKALTWARSELGCKYDWKGIFWAQILRIPRAHPDQWFCSEYAAGGLQHLGMLQGSRACTFSPGNLYTALH